MPEEIKDVNTEESSASEQEVVNDQSASDQQTEQVDSQTQESSTQEVKTEVTKPDRPEINYAMEAARKASEALEAVRQLQQQQQQVQTQPAQPQYTKAQLRAFAESAADPNHKVWALEEIDKLEKVERQTEMKQLFEGYTKRTQEEQQRIEATQFVAGNFPECFVKDETGKPIGWDNNSPLTRKIGEYMQNPALAQNPQGLVAAAKMAAFDLGVSMNRKLQSKVNQTTAQLKREQKRQLITGTGSSPQAEGSKGKLEKLAEEYRKTGSKEAFKALAKAKGLIPEL